MTNAILVIVAAAVSLGTCLMAIVFGRLPERVGALVIAAGLPLGFALNYVSPGLRPIAELAGDGAIAFTFLLLAIRFTSRWLGVVLLLYSAQFALHAFYFVSSAAHDNVYFLTNDMLFFGVTISLLAGSAGAIRSRLQTSAAGA